MRIRQEEKADHGAVDRLVRAAFACAQHADGNEAELVAALRGSAAFVPELSLVAERGGALAGHILFTEAAVGGDTVLALAPLSVAPEAQGQGVGTALMEAGHGIALALGYSYVLVLGSETYYPRVGYRPAVQFGIPVPEGFPPVHFMAKKLRADAPVLRGPVVYAREFGL